MFTKPLLVTFLLCFGIDLIWGQDGQDDIEWPSKDYVDGEDVEEADRKYRLEAANLFEVRRRKPPCDTPMCSLLDCDESGPPPVCPRNVTICRSGCACIEYCRDNTHTTYCYQVKFCRTPLRFSPDVFTTMRINYDKK